MKNIKKLCLFSILLVNILLISNTKADVSNQISIFDYDSEQFHTLYPDTFMNKLADLKTYIDTENTYNRHYIISANSSNVYVSLDLANSLYMNRYCETGGYYNLGYKEYNPTSSIYSIQTNLYLSTCDVNGQSRSVGGKLLSISYNDFINENYGTFLTDLKTYLNAGKISNNQVSPLWNQMTTGGTSDKWPNVFYPYTNILSGGSALNYTLPFIYHATREVKFINKTVNNNKTSEELCQGSIGSWTNNYYYNSGIADEYLTCGQTLPTYLDYEEENSIYEIQEPFHNIDRQTESIDMYINIGLPQSSLTDERNIILEYTFNENALDNYYVNGYYMFGKVCNYTTQYLYGTCWWEEVPHTYWSISDDTYTEEENNYNVSFKLTYDFTNSTTRYETIKLAIKQIANDFTLHIKSKEEKYNITTDINVIGYNYGFQTVGTTNNIVQILVDKKPINNNDINYTFYRIGEEEYGALNFFEYDKLTNTTTRNYIDSSIIEAYKKYIPNNNNYIQYWKELGQIILGPNSNKKLLIFIYAMDYDDEYGEVYKFYFNDEVYYTITNNNTFNIDYTENGTTINQDLTPRLDNEFIQQEYNNSLSVNISGLEELIMSYKEYKNEWIQLFNSIWIPMPDILKNILIIMYALAHCYGVYLIFKD